MRVSRSWIVQFSAWPMCSAPVTFGGGIAIEKLCSALPAASGCTKPGIEPALQDAGFDLRRLESCAFLEIPHRLSNQSMERR